MPLNRIVEAVIPPQRQNGEDSRSRSRNRTETRRRAPRMRGERVRLSGDGIALYGLNEGQETPRARRRRYYFSRRDISHSYPSYLVSATTVGTSFCVCVREHNNRCSTRGRRQRGRGLSASRITTGRVSIRRRQKPEPMEVSVERLIRSMTNAYRDRLHERCSEGSMIDLGVERWLQNRRYRYQASRATVGGTLWRGETESRHR